MLTTETHIGSCDKSKCGKCSATNGGHLYRFLQDQGNIAEGHRKIIRAGLRGGVLQNSGFWAWRICFTHELSAAVATCTQ